MYEVAIWLHAMQPYIPDFHANRDAVALIKHVSYAGSRACQEQCCEHR